MKLLALDCSTQACSVALLNDSVDKEYEVLERYELAAKSHTEHLLPMIDDVLAQGQFSLSGMDAIAFGCGPGSFTGLRICVGAVQGLAFGVGLPVVPISSLAALAQTALISTDSVVDEATKVPEKILSTIDARMDEVYWGVYNVADGLVELEGQERITAPEQVILSPAHMLDKTIIAVGSGLHYEQRIACRTQVTLTDSQLLPRAASVARLARSEVFNNKLRVPEQAQPTYLRNQVAWKKQQ